MAKPGQEEMPFLDHLEELRWRLIYALGTLAVGILIGFVLVLKFDLIALLEKPILPFLHGNKLVYTHPGDPFNIAMTASLAIGAVISAPMVLYQIWAFVSPALYGHEKKVVIPVLIGATLLFVTGVAASYYLLLPFTLEFLLGFQSASLQPMITASDYFGFAVSLSLAMGAVFELPILILALTAVGIVTPMFLTRYRRHAFVLCAVGAAVLTPGDLITSTLTLIAPLYGLYELSIVLSKMLYRSRQRRRERLEREEREAAEREAAGSAPASLLLLLAALSLAVAGPAEAQRPPSRPGVPTVSRPPTTRPATRPTTTRAGGDTLTRRDSLRGGDSTRVRGDSAELVRWVEPDSTMKALMERGGFDVTKYQGDTVVFRVPDRTLSLVGKPAAVGRDQSVLVGDSIRYNDSTRVVFAAGSPAVLRDPTQAGDDVKAREITYNVASRTANVANISTSVVSGERWFVEGKRAAVAGDTSAAKASSFYARDGTITSCDDSIPDYLFKAKQIKVVSKNVLVARPAVLYIKDVPVFWLPFIFQDLRSGRRSGMLSPRFGLSEVVRNSPSYRRHIDNIGYYWNLGDYMDAEAGMDWRSGARQTANDPGYVRLNGEVRYRWLGRFVSGRFAVTNHRQFDSLHTGTRNFSWSHQQDFSSKTHLTTDINYATNTSVQRRTTFSPYQQLATIRSNASFQRSLGVASLSVGGSQTQYPGRPTVDRTFPTLSVSSQPINVTSWLVWTPSVSYSNQVNLKNDQVSGAGAFYYTPGFGAPGLDSAKFTRNSRNTTASFETPLQIHGYSLSNSFRYSDILTNFPERVNVYTPGVSPNTGRDTSFVSTRVFARRFATQLDWTPGFQLRPVFQGSWNFVPSVSLENVASGSPTLVRTELSDGKWVAQGKRLSYGVSIAPTFYGLFPGIFGATRFRHSVQPSLSYSLAPAAKVNEEYLRALNIDPSTYVGSALRSSVTLGLATNLEAKVRSATDTSEEGGTKVKVLTLGLSSLSYDIGRLQELRRRARENGTTRPRTLAGFGTDQYNITARSDLLPGFDLNVGYDLFQGELVSDTAKFSPYLQNVTTSFSVGRSSRFLDYLFTRIFGKAVPNQSPQPQATDERPDDQQRGRDGFLEQQVASQRVAGTSARNAQFSLPRTGQGWQASISYTFARQRPVIGGNVQQLIDPTCLAAPDDFSRQLCQNRLLGTTLQSPISVPTYGGTLYSTPPQSGIQTNLTFNVTERWAAQWSTQYDVRKGEFASHQVNLQRELHDWRAVFAFTQAPNGNFAFNFFIALKAQPDIKFDYDRQTYRPIGSSSSLR